MGLFIWSVLTGWVCLSKSVIWTRAWIQKGSSSTKLLVLLSLCQIWMHISSPSVTHFPVSIFNRLSIQPKKNICGNIDRRQGDARDLLSLSFSLGWLSNSNWGSFVISSPMRQPLCLWSQNFWAASAMVPGWRGGLWFPCSQWAFLIVLLGLGVVTVSCRFHCSLLACTGFPLYE